MKIISKTEEPLLKRTIVFATHEFEGSTPSREFVRKEVAKLTSSDVKSVIVRHINTNFGLHTAQIDAAIYKNIEDAVAVEHKKLIEKHKVEEPKKEEKPAEKVEEKAPAEKNDTKSEEKPAEKVEEKAQTKEKKE